MAQTLDQIMGQLNPGYDPMRQSVSTQQAALPAQYDAQLKGLQAQDDQANQDILNQAQARGLGFSGIPVAEQAKYNASTYMPAVAKLQSDQITSQTNLADQLAKINQDERTQAEGIQQTELDRDQKDAEFQQQMQQAQEQFNEKMALQKQAQSAAASIGTLPTDNRPSLDSYQGTPQMTRGANGGYSFFDANGNPITAAAYASATGQGFRNLLAQMAGGGDQNAKIALNYVGNDARFGGAPSQYAGALNALGATGSFSNGAGSKIVGMGF